MCAVVCGAYKISVVYLFHISEHVQTYVGFSISDEL